jgi:multidrug transporter EmrE-like cation transporter
MEDRLTLNVGVGLALLCAVVTQLGFLCKHRGANAAPRVDLTRPLVSAGGLLRSRWFAVGLAITAGAWVLHVMALAVAPLSVVQAVLSTGVILLAVLGSRLFGCPVAPRQWLGVGMTAAGLMLLVLTLPGHEGVRSAFATPTMIAFEGAMLAVGALLVAGPRLGAPSHHHGALLGAAAGTLIGVSDVALKALTGVAGAGPLAVVASPWLIVAVLGGLGAFLIAARAFQEGEAVPVIASTSTTANVTAILGGILVFGDALAGTTVVVALQILAFALVAAAALLTPSAAHRPDAAAA